MRDQAHELRNLVLQHAPAAGLPAGARPQMVVLAGGKGGVGTTTMAINLSMALARQSERVVLVDGNLGRGDIAPLCGLPERHSVADVLSARRTVHEVLQPGPGGVLILPGLWTPGGAGSATAAACDRLLRQLAALGRHADVVVVDAGSGAGDVAASYWAAADTVLVVTTPDPLAVMDAYATIKLLRRHLVQPRLSVVINQADETAAEDVYERLARSCRQFLNVQLDLAGHIERNNDPPAAESGASPLLQSPAGEKAAALDVLAANVRCRQHNDVAIAAA